MRFISAAGRGARRAGLVVARAVPPLLRDLVGVLGAGLVVYGIRLVHQPSAFIAAGLMLVTAAWLLARRSAPPREET